MNYDISGLEKVSGGNKDFEKKMIKMFVDQLPGLLKKLEVELMAKDYEAFGITAHSMKPSVDMLCNAELRDLVRVLELKGKEAEHIETLSEELKYFTEKMKMVAAELQKEILD